MYTETVVESTAKVGTFLLPKTNLINQPQGHSLSELLPGFLKYAEFELCHAKQSVIKYHQCLLSAIKDLGDLSIEQVTPLHFTELKQKIYLRGAGEMRVLSIICAMKNLLRYSQDFLELQVMDHKKIRLPKRPRKEVVFLTNEEVEQFIAAIKIERRWKGNTREKGYRMDGLRLRTLVELLLGTGMRISEALSLNRDSINFEKKEAKIIGKGSKERVVFFSDRSLEWVKLYLENRTDSYDPLFLSQKNTRVTKGDVNRLFQRLNKKSGINKKISPHTLRHTTATNLLFNGCPISHVKEILGHDRLETTCRYYIGLDKTKAKEAHEKFLNF